MLLTCRENDGACDPPTYPSSCPPGTDLADCAGISGYDVVRHLPLLLTLRPASSCEVSPAARPPPLQSTVPASASSACGNTHGHARGMPPLTAPLTATQDTPELRAARTPTAFPAGYCGMSSYTTNVDSFAVRSNQWSNHLFPGHELLHPHLTADLFLFVAARACHAGKLRLRCLFVRAVEQWSGGQCRDDRDADRGRYRLLAARPPASRSHDWPLTCCCWR